jgi:TatD DNase family protein
MALEFTDTHCHIQSAGPADGSGERFTREKWAKAAERTPDAIVDDAVKAGVTRMVVVGCDVADSRLAVDFVQQWDHTWASIGIHPHESGHFVDDPAALADFSALVSKDKVVAVGECGLDYYYGHSSPADQAKILRFQLELALKHDKPVIFHVREAYDDFWPIFDSYKGIKGVLHSFTDSQANLEKALERGLSIGINGIATFTKDVEQLKMYKNIPLSRLLLETDAPFLTPSPYRGTICEPYHIKVIAEFVSELREEPLEQFAQTTTRNASTLFRI